VTALAVLIGVAGIVLALQVGLPWWRSRRRARLRRQSLPMDSRALLEAHTPLYRRLPAGLKPPLESLVSVFVAEKEFIGCAGLEVTPAMKLGIAAQACLLILNRDSRVYDELTTILVYRGAFVAPETDIDDAGVVTEKRRELIGQTFDTSRIVLSWADVEAGALGTSDGVNVVLHEFAHYLDNEAGPADGTPMLESRADHERWARVLDAAHSRLWHRIRRGRGTVIDDYGLEDEAEFFAVATETFFEKSAALKAEDAALYDELARFYRLDPASWPR
jgi:Mlc titration factor MtfA (ptsG expression regulator)